MGPPRRKQKTSDTIVAILLVNGVKTWLMREFAINYREWLLDARFITCAYKIQPTHWRPSWIEDLQWKQTLDMAASVNIHNFRHNCHFIDTLFQDAVMGNKAIKRKYANRYKKPLSKICIWSFNMINTISKLNYDIKEYLVCAFEWTKFVIHERTNRKASQINLFYYTLILWRARCACA